MDRPQFLAWVNDPRTEAELTAQISLMPGLTPPTAGSPLDDFRNVLRVHAAAQPATWTVPAGQEPAGWTPAATPGTTTPAQHHRFRWWLNHPTATAVSIKTSKLPAVDPGKAYAHTLEATGGIPPLTWSATGLPAWLSLDAATGTLTGTAPAMPAPTATIKATVTDNSGATDDREFQLAIKKRLPVWVPVAAVAAAVLVGWLLFNGGSGNKGTKVDTKVLPPPAATIGTASALNEAQVRAIATDVANKAVAANPSITASQVKEMIDKAVTDTMATIAKTGGLTEAQVRAIATDALKSLASSPSTAATQSGDSTSCKSEKISTASEVGNAGPQRQELGGGGYQLVDFYPNRGIQPIAYIVPPLKKVDNVYVAAAIGMGFGSIWQYDSPSCASYDFVPEATKYSHDRLNNGHSGLTVDLRGTTPKLVGNERKMSAGDIENLLKQDAAAIQGISLDPKQIASQVNSISSTKSSTGNSQTAASPSGNCTATQSSHDPVNGQAWVIQGSGPRIAAVWTNVTSDTSQRKLEIAAGENPSIMSGGGSVWEYPAGCQSTVDKEFASNPLPSYR